MIRYSFVEKDTLSSYKKDHIWVIIVIFVRKAGNRKFKAILDVSNVNMTLANLALLMDKIVSQSYVCPDLMIYTCSAYLQKESSLKNPSPKRRQGKLRKSCSVNKFGTDVQYY